MDRITRLGETQGRVARCEDRFLILCHAWTDGKPLPTAERDVRSLLAAFPGKRDAVASGAKAELKNYLLSNQITKGWGGEKKDKKTPTKLSSVPGRPINGTRIYERLK